MKIKLVKFPSMLGHFYIRMTRRSFTIANPDLQTSH
jgi:hypothetical protein